MGIEYHVLTVCTLNTLDTRVHARWQVQKPGSRGGSLRPPTYIFLNNIKTKGYTHDTKFVCSHTVDNYIFCANWNAMCIILKVGIIDIRGKLF